MDKTLHFKNAVIVGATPQAGKNLVVSDVVKECHDLLNLRERRVPTGFLGDYVVSQDFEQDNSSIFLHLVRANEDGSISLVPKAKGTEAKAPLEERQPPRNSDYLQKECFAYFFSDYVIILNNGIAPDTVANYLTDLARQKGFLSAKEEIRFFNIANNDGLAKIRKHQIQSLTIGARLDLPAVAATKPAISKLARIMRSVISNDPVADMAAINDYKYQLTISGNNVKVEEIDPLTESGAEFFKELDEHEASGVNFRVRLKNGEVLRIGEIMLQREIRVTRLGNSLESARIRQEMTAYRDDLLAKGMI